MGQVNTIGLDTAKQVFQAHGADEAGASAVVRQATLHGAPEGSWLARMLTRKPRMLVAVALANKTARIVWALLTKGEVYKAPVAVAA